MRGERSWEEREVKRRERLRERREKLRVEKS
jgi:hypothetical protein